MKNKLLFLSVLLLLMTPVVIISCSKSGSYSSGSNNPPMTTANTVSIMGMAYSPATLTVTAGTTVTWTNNDTMAHTVTADDNSFDSGTMNPGAKYSKVFSTAGTISYHCTIHPTMKASVVVK